MKDSNLQFQNQFQSLIKKNSSTILSKNFDKFFFEIERNLKNKKKTINIFDNNYSFSHKISELKKFKKYKKIVIIGMGGSILGTEAIHGFLKQKIKKKVYFLNDIDEKKILNIKKKESLSKILFIIISKSGNTIETISNTFALGIIKKNAKNIILISEKNNNLLFNLSKNLNLYFVEHKKFIGGRYSVLSETGIVPSYLMGVNINKLRSKILDFIKGSKKVFLKESTICLTNILNEKKYKNLVFLNYSPELEKFLFWCQQLIAESLGKKNKGFFPVISNVPKDHHSLLQLYLDGPKDKIFYIFSLEKDSKIKIKFDSSFKKNPLNKKSLNFVKHIQKNALIKVFTENKIPFREFKIKKKEELVLGQLFSYFILETILIGNLLKINPFDQPAVEKVKIYTKYYLNQKNQK